MSGRKVAGCCVHVASVIFYLSYARFNNINLPALNKHLVLIDTTKREKPNNPRLVKAKRLVNRNNDQNLDESESSSSDDSENEISNTGSDNHSESSVSETETEDKSETETTDDDED